MCRLALVLLFLAMCHFAAAMEYRFVDSRLVWPEQACTTETAGHPQCTFVAPLIDCTRSPCALTNLSRAMSFPNPCLTNTSICHNGTACQTGAWFADADGGDISAVYHPNTTATIVLYAYCTLNATSTVRVRCADGYSGPNCTRDNVCLEQRPNGGCSNTSVCVNTLPVRTCLAPANVTTCSTPGQQIDEVTGQCIDVNECLYPSVYELYNETITNNITTLVLGARSPVDVLTNGCEFVTPGTIAPVECLALSKAIGETFPFGPCGTGAACVNGDSDGAVCTCPPGFHLAPRSKTLVGAPLTATANFVVNVMDLCLGSMVILTCESNPAYPRTVVQYDTPQHGPTLVRFGDGTCLAMRARVVDVLEEWVMYNAVFNSDVVLFVTGSLSVGCSTDARPNYYSKTLLGDTDQRDCVPDDPCTTPERCSSSGNCSAAVASTADTALRTFAFENRFGAQALLYSLPRCDPDDPLPVRVVLPGDTLEFTACSSGDDGPWAFYASVLLAGGTVANTGWTLFHLLPSSPPVSVVVGERTRAGSVVLRIQGASFLGVDEQDAVAPFECACDPGFRGRACEQERLSGAAFLPLLRRDAPAEIARRRWGPLPVCFPSTCAHGGVCVPQPLVVSSDALYDPFRLPYTCHCRDGWSGRWCTEGAAEDPEQQPRHWPAACQCGPHGTCALQSLVDWVDSRDDTTTTWVCVCDAGWCGRQCFSRQC